MNSKYIVPSVAVLICLFAPAISPAAVVRVREGAPPGTPDGATWDTAYRTVQAGINAAAAGDEVWVCGIHYLENITLKAGIGLYGGFDGSETNRTHRAMSYWRTGIDGGKNGSVITIPTGANGVVVDGFTISNGSAPQGAGIYCVADSVTISNNVISGNAASGNAPNGIPTGGGIFHGGRKGLIFGNTVENNSSAKGGGIWCVGASIVRNLIRFNTVSGIRETLGGGIYTGSVVDIRDNLVTSNYAYCLIPNAPEPDGPYGGGIACDYASGSITGNTVSGNTLLAYATLPLYRLAGTAVGGGLWASQVGTGPLTISNNVISDNSASAADMVIGAGVWTNGSSVPFRNNTVVGNTGAAVKAVTGFEFGTGGGASNSLVENNILASNPGGMGTACSATVRNNCFHANGPADASYTGLNGNFDADPMLASPDGLDFRPLSGSPCVDAGNNAGILSTDLDRDGHPRLQGVAVDIGAYEAAVAIPYGMATVARALRIAAGITVPIADDFARMNAVKTGETTPTIDLSDAVWLVRHEIDEESAVASLRALVAAQEHYRAQQSPPTYAFTLPELGRRISAQLASGYQDGYYFTPGFADARSYIFTAAPQIWPGLEGIRRYFVDQTGIIRYEESGPDGNGMPATANSPWLP